jgi:hypothetical protein
MRQTYYQAYQQVLESERDRFLKNIRNNVNESANNHIEFLFGTRGDEDAA